jgi:hypothetical protein
MVLRGSQTEHEGAESFFVWVEPILAQLEAWENPNHGGGKVGLIQTRVDRSHCDLHVTTPCRVGVSLPRSCCPPHFFCIYKPSIH